MNIFQSIYEKIFNIATEEQGSEQVKEEVIEYDPSTHVDEVMHG